MRAVQIHLKLLTIVLATVAVPTGCTTLWGDHNPDDLLRGQAADRVVVQQPGRFNPVVSTPSRKEWVELRSSSPTEVGRMYALLATGEWQAAVDRARRHLSQHPGHIPSLRVLAAGLALGRDYALAGYYADVILHRRPGDADALNLKGLAIMTQTRNDIGDYHKAVRYFQQAVDADPNHVAGALNLGHLHLELGDARAAAQAFAGAAHRCGRCSAAQMGLGSALARTERWGAARRAFAAVLERHPGHPRALFHLAVIEASGMRRPERAKHHLNELLAQENVDASLRERADSILRTLKAAADTTPTGEADDFVLPAAAE